MDNEELARKANEIVGGHGFTAEVMEDVLSVGVQGDSRVYLPVILLKGSFCGWEIMERLSNEITNTLPVSRATYDLTPGNGFVEKR